MQWEVVLIESSDQSVVEVHSTQAKQENCFRNTQRQVWQPAKKEQPIPQSIRKRHYTNGYKTLKAKNQEWQHNEIADRRSNPSTIYTVMNTIGGYFP